MAGGTGVAMATTDCRRCESNKRCAYCSTVLHFQMLFVQDGKSVDQLRLEALVLPSPVSDAHCHIIATGANITPCSTQLIEQCSVFFSEDGRVHRESKSWWAQEQIQPFPRTCRKILVQGRCKNTS